MALFDGSDDAVVVIAAASRPLRRALRPLAWVILEDVALDAELEEGRLVAHTSARQVAERLGVDPGTAARALRIVRERGLLVLEREKGPAGRFGLSVYAIGTVPGVTVIPPGAGGSRVVSPSMVEPYVVDPDMDGAHLGPEKNCSEGTAEIVSVAQNPAQERGTSLARSALQVPGQGTLDLDGKLS
jgi:DNA-binding transcriptional ArsR family regulator